jgi:hypothetical protein
MMAIDRAWLTCGRTLLFAFGAGIASVSRIEAQSPAFTPHGFISSRYGTASSSLILVGYTVGPVTPMVALVEDPHGDSHEELAGLLRAQPLGRHLRVTYGTAIAKTEEAWFGELWLSPSLAIGRVRSDFRLKQYLPLEPAGHREFTMNPASVVVDLSRHLSIGAVTGLVNEAGSQHELGAGPRLGVKVSKGSLAFDGIFGLTNRESEMRVSFYTQY